jgi:hypothetical protein
MSRRRKEKPPTLSLAESLFQIDCFAVDNWIEYTREIALKSEWGHADRCPWCKRFKAQGHRVDCRGVHLRALLDADSARAAEAKEWLS